jgi:predicted dehydrogenase
MRPLNVVIVGAGHYTTGENRTMGTHSTDKDLGVLLPSLLCLKEMGLISKISIVGRDGNKINQVFHKWGLRAGRSSIMNEIYLFPNKGETNEFEFRRVLSIAEKGSVVIIATPDLFHKDVIVECIKNSLSYLVLKPAVTNLRDLNNILELHKNKSILGMVDYHKVFDEVNIGIKNDYLAGLYGDIQNIFTVQTQKKIMKDIYADQFNADINLNINHYLGCHYIHLVSYITGARPIKVISTAQHQKGNTIADLIQTNIVWLNSDNKQFSSYHIAGWDDPVESPVMTRQEFQILATKARVLSDQGFRGTSKLISGRGFTVDNPYFFNTWKNQPGGSEYLFSQYGFRSIYTFITSVQALNDGEVSLDSLEQNLPTIKESLTVTKILEAVDLSLEKDSGVIYVS